MSGIVIVEGVEIPERLIAEEAQNHPSADAAEARASAARALATKALLLDRAGQLGLEPEPELDADGREETAEEALIRAALEAEVEPSSPTEEECLRFYEARRERFCAPALKEASHILFEPQSDEHGTWEGAHYAAAWALGVLKEGLASFEELARAMSDCPSGELGGALGQIAPGDLAPEIEAVLEALEPGQIAPGPVRSRFGWHILRLDRSIPPRQAPFEVARERIRMHLESRAWAAAATRYVAGLAETARAKGVAVSLRPDGEIARPALSLGDLIGEEGAASRLEPWLRAVDPDLAAKVEAAAARKEMSAPAFVRAAVAEFVARADDEAWTRLVSAARDAEDPALAGLASILKSTLAPPRRTIPLIRSI